MIEQASGDLSMETEPETSPPYFWRKAGSIWNFASSVIKKATLCPRCLFPDAVWPAQHTGDEQRLKLDTKTVQISHSQSSQCFSSMIAVEFAESNDPRLLLSFGTVPLWLEKATLSSLRSIPIQLCALLESCGKWSLEVLQLQYRKRSKLKIVWATKSEVWTLSWSLSEAKMLKTVPKAEDPAQSISIPRMTSETKFEEIQWIRLTFLNTSWGKDHDKDHLSHLTRIQNSKSCNWKGFKLKTEFNPASVFLASSLDIGPILGESERKKSNWTTTSMPTLMS